MFALAYVILPFSGTPPEEAIRASLAPFQRGGRGDLPDAWLAFRDETDGLLEAHEARFTFTIQDGGGMRIEGGHTWYLDTARVREAMRRLGSRTWTVRFADTMDLDTFHDRFGRELERHPNTGAFGRWVNPLGRWDWWDLGGRFDGCILGEHRQGNGRRAAKVSSGASPGRTILTNIEDRLAEALGQPAPDALDVRADQNIELVATLSDDALADRGNAYPSALVLPPGAFEDRLRWLDSWWSAGSSAGSSPGPSPGPREAFAALGLASDAGWEAVVRAVYRHFEDHWAAGVAYHL